MFFIPPGLKSINVQYLPHIYRVINNLSVFWLGERQLGWFSRGGCCTRVGWCIRLFSQKVASPLDRFAFGGERTQVNKG